MNSNEPRTTVKAVHRKDKDALDERATRPRLVVRMGHGRRIHASYRQLAGMAPLLLSIRLLLRTLAPMRRTFKRLV